MLELIIIALLIAVLAAQQTQRAATRDLTKRLGRMEIDLFKISIKSWHIEFNLRNLFEWLPAQLDTGAAFEQLRQNTNDESLRSVAMAAAIFAKPGAVKEVSIRKNDKRPVQRPRRKS